MLIEYKDTHNIDPIQLDNLWSAIGWKKRGAQKWEEVISKSSYIYSAWDKNTLVGTGRIIEDGIMCMFYDIGIHPEYQRQNIGSSILNKLIEQVKDKKYASIGLFAWKENPANLPFYKKFGFTESSGMELTKYMHPE
jgi:ribosomal protein S18 acetylase RimI-like enzyme